MPDPSPSSVRVRTYNAGFGDCFLLTFSYGDFNRHLLIDFGSTSGSDTLHSRIARDIRTDCGGKLHAVVATHRHRDHVSGFACRKDGEGSGDIIARCQPEVVIQPWTEDPGASGTAEVAFIRALSDMQEVSRSLLAKAGPGSRWSASVTRQIRFLGEENLPTPAALANLRTMGGRHVYASFGTPSGLAEILPGVRTHVLGPPTVSQAAAARKHKARDDSEFWRLQAAAESGSAETGLFPDSKTWQVKNAPPHTRWFLQKMRSVLGEEALGIARTLDMALNNTSLILLFEAGGKKLLFPGDAQNDSWSYALSKPAVRKLLRSVDLYKVGHHGGSNATPRSLWELFEKRSTGSLHTIVSTLAGKHGSSRSGTEVPAKKLMETLRAESVCFTTQSLGRSQIHKDFVITLR